jgi:hypothetical protein
LPAGGLGLLRLTCERPGRPAWTRHDTVAVIRREHGLVMNSMGIGKPQEWLVSDKDGYVAQNVKHLSLLAAHRAFLLG